MKRISSSSNSENGRAVQLLADYDAGEWVLRMTRNFGRQRLCDVREASLADAHATMAAFMRGDAWAGGSKGIES